MARNPYSRVFTDGGLTGTVTPSRVTGGTMWNPQFAFSGKLTPENYNAWASGYQQMMGNTMLADGYYPTGVSGTERWKFDGTNISSAPSMATNPAVALRIGMPINRDLVAAEIANRRGTPVDDSAYFRADWRIGNQLYRKNVKGGFAPPGTYARQGGGIPSGSTWGQVSQRGKRG